MNPGGDKQGSTGGGYWDAPPPEIKDLIQGASAQVLRAVGSLSELSLDQHSLRGRVLAHSLHRSNDLVMGCIATAIGGCHASLEILSRALVEELINAHWISLSESNAEGHLAGCTGEALRVCRTNLFEGHAILSHKVTGNKFSKKALLRLFHRRAQAPKKQHSLKEKAVEGGLDRVYSQAYRTLSLGLHGFDFRSSPATEEKWKRISMLFLAFKATHLAHLAVIENFSKTNKSISTEVIYRILLPPSEP